MIELKVSDIVDPLFSQAAAKLGQVNTSGKLSYRIAKILDKAGQELKAFREAYRTLAHKYGEVDAEGKVIPSDAPPHFKLKPDMTLSAYTIDFDTLVKRKFAIEQKHILLEEIETAGLTAGEMLAIEPLLAQGSLEGFPEGTSPKGVAEEPIQLELALVEPATSA